MLIIMLIFNYIINVGWYEILINWNRKYLIDIYIYNWKYRWYWWKYYLIFLVEILYL